MDIIDLDRNWRIVINNIPLVDNINEFLVVKYIITYPNEIEIIKDYPYIFAWEFPINPEESHVGNIDLILTTDGMTRFLIIECKYIAESIEVKKAGHKRREKLKNLKTQLNKHQEQFQKLKPNAEIKCVSITNNDLLDFLRFQFDEWEQIEKQFGFKSKIRAFGDFIEDFMKKDPLHK